MKGLIGKKLGMSQIYDATGKVTPVTVVQAGPCTVIDQMTEERDGYSSIQLGFGKKKAKNVSKAVQGHCAKSGRDKNPPIIIREFRSDDKTEVEIGSVLTVEQFVESEFVDIVGTVKGRGFQGVVKKYNFGGGRYSHGGGWKRKPGSIGQCESPAHVDKGKKMPGQMGNCRRTIQNLEVMRVVKEDNLLYIKGAIPGPNGGIVIVRSAIKKPLAKQG